MSPRIPPEELISASYRRARMYALESAPFTVDRFVQYAALCHEAVSEPQCLVYAFDTRARLLKTDILFRGYEPDMTHYLPTLQTRMQALHAARLGLSITAAGDSLTFMEIHRASRPVLYCQKEGISLLDIVLICGHQAIPLCRASGVTP